MSSVVAAHHGVLLGVNTPVGQVAVEATLTGRIRPQELPPRDPKTLVGLSPEGYTSDNWSVTTLGAEPAGYQYEHPAMAVSDALVSGQVSTGFDKVVAIEASVLGTTAPAPAAAAITATIYGSVGPIV